MVPLCCTVLLYFHAHNIYTTTFPPSRDVAFLRAQALFRFRPSIHFSHACSHPLTQVTWRQSKSAGSGFAGIFAGGWMTRRQQSSASGLGASWRTRATCGGGWRRHDCQTGWAFLRLRHILFVSQYNAVTRGRSMSRQVAACALVLPRAELAASPIPPPRIVTVAATTIVSPRSGRRSNS